MSFWDGVYKVGKAVYGHLQNKVDEMEGQRQRLEGRSDEDLMRICKSSSYSHEKRMAAAQILKDRGYGN